MSEVKERIKDIMPNWYDYFNVLLLVILVIILIGYGLTAPFRNYDYEV